MRNRNILPGILTLILFFPLCALANTDQWYCEEIAEETTAINADFAVVDPEGEKIAGAARLTLKAAKKRRKKLAKKLKRLRSKGAKKKRLKRARSKIKEIKQAVKLIKLCRKLGGNPPDRTPPESKSPEAKVPSVATPTGNTGAGEKKPASPDDTTEGGSETLPPGPVTFDSVRSIIESRCMACHGAFSGSRKWVNSEEYFLSTRKVVAGNLAGSSLYTYLSGNPEGFSPGYMPKGMASLSVEEISLLAGWIRSLGMPETPTTTGTGTGSGTEGTSGTGSSGTGGGTEGGGVATPTPTPLPQFSFFCSDASTVSISPSGLKRLTRKQYQNTFTDLLYKFDASLKQAILTELQPYLDNIPEDTRIIGVLEALVFPRTDLRVTATHIEKLFEAAAKFAAEATASSDRRQQLFGCEPGTDSAGLSCLRSFLEGFGKRVLRRPPTVAQIDALVSSYQASEPSSALTLVLTQLLMQPQFLYHYEEGNPTETQGLFRLDDYELASRISYLFWNSMPDEELLDAASQGRLTSDPAFYSAQVQRVFRDARTKDVIRQFFREHLGLDTVKELDTVNSPAFATLTEDFQFELDEQGKPDKAGLLTAMKAEIDALVDYYVWEGKSFAEMFTSPYSFTTDPALARIYGVAPWNGNTDNLVPFPDTRQARGILGRAIMQISGGAAKSKAHLGAKTMREWTCQDIPPPPPSVEEVAAPPPPSASVSSRQAFEQLTAPSDCTGCHSQINPPGFVYDLYDAIGRFQTSEKSIDLQGNLLAVIPLDTHVEFLSMPGRKVAVSSPVEMFEEMIESGLAESCIAQQFFRFTFRQSEDLLTDSCALAQMHKSSTGTLQELFQSVTETNNFKFRRIALD